MKDAPRRDATETARKLLRELAKTTPAGSIYGFKDIAKASATTAILSADTGTQIAVVLECVDLIAAVRDKLGAPQGFDGRYMNLSHGRGFPQAACQILDRLLRRKLPFSEDHYLHLINQTSYLEQISLWALPHLGSLVSQIEKHCKGRKVSEPLDTALGRLAEALAWSGRAAEIKLTARITALCKGPQPLPIEAGEAWSDRALADLKAMKGTELAAWMALIGHCRAAAGGQPTSKWLDAAKRLVAAVGRAEFKRHVLTWLPLVDKRRTQVIEHWPEHLPNPNLLIIEPHADILKGVAWCTGLAEDGALARVLTDLAQSAYRKVPLIGPRAVKIGNACVTALGMMPGLDAVGQLAVLKVRVKFRPAQKGIEHGLSAAARRAGVARDELEEMSVPTYGLTDVGRLEEEFGEFTARLTVAGDGPGELLWSKLGGKPQKSVPAAVVKDHAEALKDLKTAAKDIQKMVPAQRERLDSLYRLRKCWPLTIWRERYIEHPLVGILARRLFWTFTTRRQSTTGIWHGGQLVGVDGKPLTGLSEKTTVSLWHPIGQAIGDVLGCRDWLESHQVRQPFKQAHREIYVLTDAERNTRVYSNRFAAHILKQHQFHALCGVRGWRNTLRLLVDQEFPPARLELPAWNLRAEFWIEGAGDNPGTDTNEAGTFLYLSTDQVRFYPLGAATSSDQGAAVAAPGVESPEGEPVPLDTIAPLVFSEVLRDVDLFVGVASVGNDPNWSDGGPDGRYRGYWNDYAFGNLSATAQTRKTVLERLIPRLRIADRCSFSDKFLHVRGQLRSYKIHLGSSNILMTPDDQYLCIVAKSSTDSGDGKLFLPFEGDGILSQILSKALLLAEDSKITDSTIVSQIRPNRP
jgi:hypothetical protein